MKKGLSLLVCATALIGLSQLALAADGTTQNINAQGENYDGTGTANIDVNGTLGASNTDPTAPIDPTDPTDPSKPNPEWINVTVPTATIFYNTIKDQDIKSPTYTITNNSGRPVTVAVNSFGLKSTSTTPTVLENDYNLTLDLTSKSTVETASTPLITKNVVATSFSGNLVTLANDEGKQTASATAVADSNIATFTYGGNAKIDTESQKPSYTLNLKFTPVTTEFENN